MDDRKSRIANMATLAQLVQQESGNRNRYRQALDMLIEAEEEADKLVADLKEALAEYVKEGERLKAKFRASRGQGFFDARGDKSKEAQSANKGKGKDRARAESETPDLDLEADEEGIPKNPAGDAHRAKGISLHQRLREARIVLHKIKFVQGDVYHVLGKSYEDAENDAYAAAEDLRKELLKSECVAIEKSQDELILS